MYEYDEGEIGYEDEAMLDAIVSGREIVGDYATVGGREIVGAAAPRRLPSALAQARMRQAKGVATQRDQSARRMWAAFPATVVAGSGTTQISIRPNQLFRPEDLIIPNSLSSCFHVTDFRVNNRSMFVASGGEIPAEVWSHLNPMRAVLFDSADQGSTVDITVVNQLTTSATFYGLLTGSCILP